MLLFAMPDQFTVAQVEAVAALARLELGHDERERLAKQLTDILEYARQVQRIDTSGVAPTASVASVAGAGREDAVVPSLPRDVALANAPDAAVDAGLFRVPRVIG
jgi:aspartyl-tRNA(Asn)/glutamyl-tRNA(Gln) amidotransferase subunit C